MQMRQKVGTTLDTELVKRAKVRAAQEGKALNTLLETALQAYLARHGGTSGPQLVKEGWGVFRVSPRELKVALRGEMLEA